MGDDPMNISSIVVKAAPGKGNAVLEGLRASGLCEVHFHDDQGRIVVIIEGRSIDEEMEKLKAIQALPSVVAAHLVYAYSEDELARDRDRISTSGNAVPAGLLDR